MTNITRRKRNLRKGYVPAYERDVDFTRRLIESYGSKKQRTVRAMVAATQERRRSNAATAIASRKVSRQVTRGGRKGAAIRASREGD